MDIYKVQSDIKIGAKVKQGQKLGETGNAISIDSDRYHLHLIIFENGTNQSNKVNPNNYLNTKFNLDGSKKN